MDAPQPTDAHAELADLRRRAYGPDGDIHSDSAALARLSELEEQQRGMEQTLTPSDSPAVSTSDRVLASSPSPVAQTIIEPDAEGPSSAPAATSSASRGKRGFRWSYPGIVAMLAGAIVIGVGLGITLPRLLPAEAPAATVRPIDPGDLTADFLGDRGLAYFGLDDDSLVPYEMFGASRPWSGVNASGSRCIFVEVNGQMMDGGCTPHGLPPTAEYVEIESPAVPGDAPVRRVVRYVQAADGRIDIWVAPAPDSDS